MASYVDCIWENGVLIPRHSENLKDWFLAQILEAPSNVNTFRISFEAVVDEDKMPQYPPPQIYEQLIAKQEEHIKHLHNALLEIRSQAEKDSFSSNPMDYIYAHQKILAAAVHALEDEQRMFING